MAENKQALAELYKKYNLNKDDVFKHKLGFVIITRTGIEKIQMTLGFEVDYDVISISEDFQHCLIKATGVTKEGMTIQSFGEATPKNNRMAYPVAMAEKRALSRVVLKAAGLYALGVYGEDESEDFKSRSGSQPIDIENHEPSEPQTPAQSAQMNENISKIQVKLEAGEANPVQVKAWLDSNKDKMTKEQLAAMQKLLAPFFK